jgi:hypothetical protein
MFTARYFTALEAFTIADKAWSAALERNFGNQARDVRYRPLGANATPQIAKLYSARQKAFKAWEAARH